MTIDIIITIIFSLLGIILILAEIFLLPGFTIAGVGGFLFSIGGIFYAYSHLGVTGGTITLVTSLLVFAIVFFRLIRSNALDKIALKTNINSTVETSDMSQIHIGDTGTTLSRLNPVGKVKVNNITVEAKSLGDFIDEDTIVEVVKVNVNQVIVKNHNS